MPLHRTEASLTFKLAKRSAILDVFEKNVHGLFEVSAPGSFVIKKDEYTSVIKNRAAWWSLF